MQYSWSVDVRFPVNVVILAALHRADFVGGRFEYGPNRGLHVGIGMFLISAH
jgi:hypothetical protein